MRIRFTDDFDYVPTEDQRLTIAYKAGMELTVRREAGEAAVAASKGEEITDPATPPEPPAAKAKKPAASRPAKGPRASKAEHAVNTPAPSLERAVEGKPAPEAADANGR